MQGANVSDSWTNAGINQDDINNYISKPTSSHMSKQALEASITCLKCLSTIKGPIYDGEIQWKWEASTPGICILILEMHLENTISIAITLCNLDIEETNIISLKLIYDNATSAFKAIWIKNNKTNYKRN